MFGMAKRITRRLADVWVPGISLLLGNMRDRKAVDVCKLAAFLASTRKFLQFVKILYALSYQHSNKNTAGKEQPLA